jgi:hypothetical protein
MIEHEVNTWVQEEQVRIKCKLPEKRAGFRTTTSGGGCSGPRVVPNSTEIGNVVRDIYQNMYGTPPGIVVEEVDVVPAGPEVEVSGWKCRGGRGVRSWFQ